MKPFLANCGNFSYSFSKICPREICKALELKNTHKLNKTSHLKPVANSYFSMQGREFVSNTFFHLRALTPFC